MVGNFATLETEAQRQGFGACMRKNTAISKHKTKDEQRHDHVLLLRPSLEFGPDPTAAELLR